MNDESSHHQRAETHAELQHIHSKEAIRKRLAGGPRYSYLKDFVYGAIDGAVTTFAIVSGVAGAGLSSKIVIILGVANLLGDGFSMAASNYLSTKADEQLRDKARRMERHHIETVPEGEKEEVRQIFAAKGFTGKELEAAVKTITSNKERWVDTMIQEEFGLTLQGPVPMRAALSTFIAFFVVGAVPLIAFVVELFVPLRDWDPFFISTVLTGVAFFVVGALKGRFVDHKWHLSGLEILFVGGMAAFLAYLVGLLLKGIGVG
jgi:vacuolar iron transporter family protein